MSRTLQIVSFPLYHGTSSHYLGRFKPGATTEIWPFKGAALSLLKKAWDALRTLGHPAEWWIESILSQESGHSNWRHGELYVTPSLCSAIRYATGGAACGGELLTICREAFDKLTVVDRKRACSLLNDATSIAGFLDGSGSPIVVEFHDVRTCDLLPEQEIDDVQVSLSRLGNEEARETIGQQTNFRLGPGCGTVSQVFRLKSSDVNDPQAPYELVPILQSELWDSDSAIANSPQEDLRQD